MTHSVMGVCAHCRKPTRISARGLCESDRKRLERMGRLHEYPRVTRTAEDFAEDFRVLRGRGLTLRQIARAMGYSPSSMSQTVYRARKAGLLVGVS